MKKKLVALGSLISLFLLVFVGCGEGETTNSKLPSMETALKKNVLPEYLGVFYIYGDTLIEMFEGEKRSHTLPDRQPKFYGYGARSPYVRIEDSSGSGWMLRVYPVDQVNGVPLFRYELHPNVFLPHNTNWKLQIGNSGFMDDVYKFRVDTSTQFK
jgi:hypothetical protein